MSRVREDDLARISQALDSAREVLRTLPGFQVSSKGAAGPVTDADHAIDGALRALLPQPGEGWLSEETADDHGRLACRRVWVVDPLDGTLEFVAGIPEWVVSVGLVEDGRAVAGGICNPARGETFLGAVGLGLTLNGQPVRVREQARLAGALVLASRSEVKRGEWTGSAGAFELQPMGSVAYKMARVAAGLADATWTLSPKHEWDVAAGTALVLAGGGRVALPGGEAPCYNRPETLLPGLVATSAALASEVEGFLRPRTGAGSPSAALDLPRRG